MMIYTAFVGVKFLCNFLFIKLSVYRCEISVKNNKCKVINGVNRLIVMYSYRQISADVSNEQIYFDQHTLNGRH